MQSSGVVGIPEFYSGYANFQYRLWFIWRRLDGLVDVDQIGWSGMISSCPWLWEDEASADEECIKVFAEGLSLLPHIPPLEWVNACQTLQVRLPRTRSPPHPLAPLTSQTRLPFIAWLMVAESPRMDDNPKRIEHLILDWAQLIAIPEKASPCHFCRISHILPVWIRTMRQICELDQFRSIPWTHKCNCWKSCLTAAQEHSVPTQMSLSKDSVAFHALYELVVPLWPLVCWVLYRTIMDDGRVEAFLDILRTPDRDLLEWDDNDEHYLSQMKASDKHRLFAEWIQYMVEIDLSGWARIRTATYTEDRRLDLDCQIDFLDDTHTRLVAFTRKHISTWNDFEGIRIAVENMINTLLSPLKIGFDIGAFFPTADDDEGPTPADFESKEFWVLPNFGRPPTDNKIMFASIWNTPDTSVLMRVRYMDMVQRLDPSFQNLGAYTYFHMVRQPTLGLPIETLRRLESHFWPEYDENCARSNRYFLTRCSSELDGLFAFLKQLDKTSKTNHAISKEIYESINRDIPGIVVKVVGALREQDLCDEIMESRGSQAHELLNLLQALLDLEPFSAVKPMIWKTLVRLSRASSLHPGCFPITGLQRVGQVVAGGGFGDIQKGLVNGQSVSIKIMRIFQDTGVEAALKDFSQEALIWRQLSHPNLLPFYGLYYLEDRLCLVSPWMEHGNIMDFLAKKPPNIHRVSLILDVALGLEYLHKKKVIHGDLKAINILVTPSRRACICDFGLSSIVNEITLRLVHSTTTAPKGTPRYYAPELLQSNAKKHFASDTYAFACVCYEILTGHVPFHTERNEIFVMLQILQGKRPQQTASCAGTAKLDDLWELLQSCWQEIPEMRPTAAQIVERLKGPSIGAITTTSTTDWDEELTCKFRRSLQQRPLLPSVNQIERLIFGDEAAQGCPECLLDREFPEWQEKKGKRYESKLASRSLSI
ncbi:hypothetical protein B0H16DRAFT_808645 [Mycena metata]|uniref:Protein kinase domain-containing protein n=1 Tax=Mycena metata TaxID=1033252 RepID=A0AAD7K658_9AGAR|nr:hypothetical protein B0H16DRAFT_808645 [Mycena metata]